FIDIINYDSITVVMLSQFLVFPELIDHVANHLAYQEHLLTHFLLEVDTSNEKLQIINVSIIQVTIQLNEVIVIFCKQLLSDEESGLFSISIF
ncbi:hypothetical protein ACJX0J_017621, partial [Zea mays]